jgi:hypothetical protein
MAAPAPAPAPASPPETDFWALLKAVGETAALFGFFASLAGWSYISAYYSAFGFQPMELDISTSVESLFAINVAYRSAIPLLIAMAAALLISFLPVDLRRFRAVGVLVCILGASVFLYVRGASLGASAAQEDFWDTGNRLPSVGFFATASQPDAYPSCVSPATPSIDCRMLFHGNNAYHFFRPFQKGDGSAVPTGAQPANLDIYSLPDEKVQLVQYQRGVK